MMFQHKTDTDTRDLGFYLEGGGLMTLWGALFRRPKPIFIFFYFKKKWVSACTPMTTHHTTKHPKRPKTVQKNLSG